LIGRVWPIFTEKGSIIRRVLGAFVVGRRNKTGLQHIYTPELANIDNIRLRSLSLLQKETMYPVMKVDEEELMLRR